MWKNHRNQKPQKLGVETGHTNTAQITPSLHLFSCTMSFQVISEHNQRRMSLTKKRCRDGVICAVFVCPVSTPSFCGFWHCHPYIPEHYWKMFYLLVCVIFCCTIVHHIGGCCSLLLPSGTNKQTCDHRQLLLCVMGWEYIARS